MSKETIGGGESGGADEKAHDAGLDDKSLQDAFLKRIRSVSADTSNIEKYGRFSANDIESIFLGKGWGKRSNTYKGEHKKMQDEANLSNSQAKMSLGQTKKGDYKMTESDALEQMFDYWELQKTSVQPKEYRFEVGFLGFILNKMLPKKSTEHSYIYVPTAGMPIDHYYGADAVVHTAVTTQEKGATKNKQRPYVTIGITTDRNKVKKGNIKSDVEVYMPSDYEFINQLFNRPDILREVSQLIADRVHTAYLTKEAYMARKEEGRLAPYWIDVEDMVRPLPKSA